MSIPHIRLKGFEEVQVELWQIDFVQLAGLVLLVLYSRSVTPPGIVDTRYMSF